MFINSTFKYIYLSLALLWAPYVFAQEYVLGVGDQVAINVYQEDDLSMEVIIDKRGTITYPFLGELRIQGLSVRRLEALLHEGLEGDYLVQPRVNVTIKQYRDFFVDGEVNDPGGYPYKPGLTVQKAIALAGGFAERADKDKILIQHEGSDGKRAVRVKPSYIVKPGDVIIVEESFF